MKGLMLAMVLCMVAGCASTKTIAKPAGLIMIADGVFVLQFEADGADEKGAIVAIETVEALETLATKLCGPSAKPDIDSIDVIPDKKPLITLRIVCVRHQSQQEQQDLGGIR